MNSRLRPLSIYRSKYPSKINQLVLYNFLIGYRSQAKVLRDVIKGQYLEKLSKLADCQQTEISNKLNGTDVNDPPKIIRPSCLTWYPDQLAWQLNLTRKDIRREEAYFKLHNFLISETESGNISRQETVSMIPPIVLDVKPHHKVLDMCAAPGSKTGQLIEAMHAIEDVVPEGKYKNHFGKLRRILNNK